MNAGTPSFARKTRSLSFTRTISNIISYALLIIFSLIMILPLLFLLNGSLQPEWQINAIPVVWLPHKWLSVQAGTTNRYLNKYLLKDTNGKQIEVIQVGLRSYTTVVDASRLTAFESVPRKQLGEAVPNLAGGLKVNERDWKKPDGSVEKVVAMARDLNNDNNLLVVPASQLEGALYQYPLDVVNQSKAGSITISGVDVSTRMLPDGRQGVAIGPEDEFWVMSPAAIASQATMVPAKMLGDKDFKSFGRTQLAVYPVKDQPADARFISLTQESWQPLLPQDVVQQYGFLAKESQLSPEHSITTANGINLTTRIYTPAAGGPQEVAILFANPIESLVISTQHLEALTAAPYTGLVEPGSTEIGTVT